MEHQHPSFHSAAKDDDEEKKSDSSGAMHPNVQLHVPNLSHQDDYDDIIRQPQHLIRTRQDVKALPNLDRLTSPTMINGKPTEEDNQDGVKYYRIVYRGVVALLSQPDHGASRSGCYLGYGEIIASRSQIPIVADQGHPNRSEEPQQQLSAIRVDQVLTGGYAFDPPTASNLQGNANTAEDASETPKKSNIQGYTTSTAAAPIQSGSASSPAVNIAICKSSSSEEDNVPLDLSKLEAEAMRCQHEGARHQGFVFAHNRRHPHLPIVEPLSCAPLCQHGRFFYKIVSTTPLPILSGPSTDAPLSKAMVLPGTVHEVSFRIHIAEANRDGVKGNGESDIWFLRLGRRQGYIASRRIGRVRNQSSSRGELVVKDVTEEINASGLEPIHSNYVDDAATTTTTSTSGVTHANSAVLSVLSTSIASSATARNPSRRHRPPRRQRENAQDDARAARNNRIQRNINNVNTSMNTHPHDTSALTNISLQSHSMDLVHQAPSSNVSLLSDDASLPDFRRQQQQQETSFSSYEHANSHNPRFNGALSPDRSVARSVMSNQSSQQPQQHSTFFLMRATAPRGLRILDAPHFQVNNLIHGTQQSSIGGITSTTLAPNSSTDVAALSALNSTKNQHHLFHTMAGRITATNGMAPMDNAMIFDPVTKTRTLPRGAVFEASKRMESSDALFHQGAGLIKLADNSGWVIVPHGEDLEQQYRNFHGGASTVKEGEALRGGYEEMGNAVILQGAANESLDQSFIHATKKGDSNTTSTPGVFMRVVARQGAAVVCAPPAPPVQKNDISPGSPASSAVTSSTHPDQLALGKSDSTSDVASSVGSSFLDSMFRGAKRPEGSDQTDNKESNSGTSVANVEKPQFASTTIACGICVQVEPHIPSDHPQRRSAPAEFARLKGGQGWLPLFIAGKPSCIVCPRSNSPEFRNGSFWFRVQAQRGIKVRLGPSNRAPSIKSSDGVYFRFECGEFLRSSEIMTVYREDSHGRTVSESFAKLYRNRHVRLAAPGNNGQSDVRQLASLTSQAEWVQVHDDSLNELYLRECQTGPRIERHRQGWRYRIVIRSGISVKRGPSFQAEDSGIYVEEGDSVVVIERVTSPDENGVTWLRMKEGKGWLHDVDLESGEALLVPHTLRNRAHADGRPIKPRRPSSDNKNQQIAYNTIIARLFHNDLPGDNKHKGASGCHPGTIGR